MSTAMVEIGAGGEKALVWRILEFLKERRFEPGERLPAERSLATRFGVGRNALREALAALISLRVVEARPNSGIYLRHFASESSIDTAVLLAEMGEPPSPQEILETMEVRRPLEREACRLACKRSTAQDIEVLQHIMAETDIIIASKGNIADLDQAFHVALAEAGHNSVLVRVLHSFYCLSLERRRVYFADIKRAQEAATMHRKLADAIAKRDATLADRLMTQHVDNARGHWVEILGSSLGVADGAERNSGSRVRVSAQRTIVSARD